MSILSPREIRAYCSTYGLSPQKIYGQHYLITPNPVTAMVTAAAVQREDTIVEIGPGFGVLTSALSKKGGRIIAFEIEQQLRPFWDEKKTLYPNVEIVWGNVLNQFRKYMSACQKYKVVANLPYQITSDILRLVFDARPFPTLVVVMVQKEVAHRITERPGNMSLLSVAMQYYGQCSVIADVPRGCFWPVPKVDSAIVRIDTNERPSRPPALTDKDFFSVVRSGFQHPRKQLWHNLAAGLHLERERVKEYLYRVMGNDKVRPEELSVVEWIRLALLIHYGPLGVIAAP